MLQRSGVSGPVFSFWRLWIGAAVLGSAALGVRVRTGQPLVRNRTALRWPALAGVSFGIHQLMFMSAVKMTSVVDVALMNALAPIITALGAWWLFRERPGSRFFAWSAVAIGGGAFLALGASAGPTGNPGGMVLAVLNVVFFAGFFLTSKRGRDHIDVLPFLAGVMLVSAVVVSGYVLAVGEPVGAVARLDLLLAAGVALGPGALGHFVMTWPLRWVPANIPPVMRLAQPALSGGLALLVLGEPLTFSHLLGGLIVVTGAFGAISSRDGRKLRQQARDRARAAPARPGGAELRSSTAR